MVVNCLRRVVLERRWVDAGSWLYMAAAIIPKPELCYFKANRANKSSLISPVCSCMASCDLLQAQADIERDLRFIFSSAK